MGRESDDLFPFDPDAIVEGVDPFGNVRWRFFPPGVTVHCSRDGMMQVFDMRDVDDD